MWHEVKVLLKQCNMICIHNFVHSERKNNINNITFKIFCRPLCSVVGGKHIWWETCCVYLLHDHVCKSLKWNHDGGWDCIRYLPLYAKHLLTRSVGEAFHLVLILTLVQSGSKRTKMTFQTEKMQTPSKLNSNMLL